MTHDLHVESSGAGAPLVMLHGWAMHAGLWGPLVPRLAQRYRVHAVDLPGHGYSADIPPASLPAIAERLAQRFGSESARLTVLGWSLGAMAALQWALAAPAQIEVLLLVGATPRFIAAPDWPHAMDEATLVRFGDELQVSHKLTLQRFLSLQLNGSEQGRSSLAHMRQALFVRGEPPRQALAAALALLRTADLRDDVAALVQPTLLIAGERDTLTPPGAARWLARALPKATLSIIRGAAHVPFLSHPEEVVAAITAFEHER